MLKVIDFCRQILDRDNQREDKISSFDAKITLFSRLFGYGDLFKLRALQVLGDDTNARLIIANVIECLSIKFADELGAIIRVNARDVLLQALIGRHYDSLFTVDSGPCDHGLPIVSRQRDHSSTVIYGLLIVDSENSSNVEITS